MKTSNLSYKATRLILVEVLLYAYLIDVPNYNVGRPAKLTGDPKKVYLYIHIYLCGITYIYIGT